MKKVVSLLILLMFLITLVHAAELPNPASVKCKEDGYKTEIRKMDDGSQYSVCMFEDSECDEWQYFRGECKPKQCNKVEGYWNCAEGCYPPMECCAFQLKCAPYEEAKGFRALIKKYFYLIFAWLWVEEEEKEDSFKKTLEKEPKKEYPEF